MSSCGSIPAVGVPVTLRILSAPEPREHRPRSCTASIMATEFFASISRIWIFARVVTCAYPPPYRSARSASPASCAKLQDAVRQSQTAHVGILVGGDVEQSEVAPAEIIRRLRILVFRGVRFQPLVSIERVLIALELLRVRQLAACRNDAILRFARGGLGTDRLA